MSRRLLLSLVCVCSALLFLAPISKAKFELRVDEKSTRVFLKELAPDVALVVENGSKDPVRVAIRLQLLAPSNKVSASTERKVDLKSGRQTVPFTLPFKSRDLTPDEEDDILWYRIHYQITPAGSQTPAADGIMSLSEITPDLFNLQVVGPRMVVPGKSYTPRVRTAHPLTRQPLKNVHIKGLVTATDTDNNDISLTSSAFTDENGYAQLDFKLPHNLDEDDFDIEIEGTLGLVTVKADSEIDLSNQSHLMVSTDKPLYQPGQTVYARLLFFGPSRHALADKTINLKINDPEDTVVFSSTLKTSRFGIAATEWHVPDTTKLGDYTLEFESTDSDEQRCTATVKISRYDLPTFSVNVKTDHPYYRPGQEAQIEVKGDYLFGQPVTKGHVKLVRETERKWNYREQKYDIEEGDKYEGETGKDGVFKARINLSEDYEELGNADYSRFEDLPYTAYFTDPTTNRTEQRRFNIRITKDAIHIYVIRPRDSYSANPKLPLEFFVSTFYADGSPAPSRLTIRLAGDENPVLRQVRTNQYGLAKISQLRIPKSDENVSTLNLKMEAEDKDGQTGSHAESIYLEDKPTIVVNTTKSLFAPADPIEATVTSTVENLAVTVTVSREGAILNTQQLKLRNGRASIILPYKPDYKDELTIAAFGNADDEDDEELIWGAHTILYPRKRDLTVNLQSASWTYRPGEQAHVKFQATSSEGRAVESALGVVVTDRAVDERIRTDQESGSRYGGFYGDTYALMGSGDSIGMVTRKALEQINMAKPVPADLALVAEAILNQGHDFNTRIFNGGNYETRASGAFGPYIAEQFKPAVEALKKIYVASGVYPKDASSLQRLLSGGGIDFQALRDPWNQAYRPRFTIERAEDVLMIECAGPDKQFDTSDDFHVTHLTWPYFKPIGEALDRAVNSYHQRTGKYINDFETLREELRSANINLDTLRDPWSKPYKFQFEVNGTNFQIRVTTTQPGSSEFGTWLSAIDYFAKIRWDIDVALDRLAREKTWFPGNETELHDALLPAGFDTTKLLDPWGRRYYFVFDSTAFYGDKATIENRSIYNQTPVQQQFIVKPVTKRAQILRIKSAGADGKEGTPDDFQVGFFSATTSEQSANDEKPQPVKSMVTFNGSTGAIKGIVQDPNGAVVSGAQVTAKLQQQDKVFESTTDDAGKFLLRNLPVGLYEVRATMNGFKPTVISQVLIRSSELVELNLTLDVGAMAEMVSVMADNAAVMNTANSTVSSTIVSKFILLAPGVAAAKQQLATPRVREYFPETLLWQPQLTTDKKGRAQLDFKLADNITTWRMSVIGSTEEGELGTAETDIRAFQPFFAELDPPRILTEGDRISLPVVLRNYLDKKQTVDLTLRPESWFKLIDSNQKRTEVAAGDSKNEVFNLETVASVKDGKQRITALGSEFSDAIEKPVTVHPDGEEKAETISDLIDLNTTMSVNLPANTIANSARIELKVYPNLMTHVWESVEAIMKRPYGCGEQTISSTYPSLLVVRYLKDEKQDSPIALKARKYLEAGYQRLLGYQSPDGGFTYWGQGESNLALTAYALRFLNDAATVMQVDAEVVQKTRQWLLNQQLKDGSWPVYNGNKEKDLRQTAMLTALVTRSLAPTESPNTATPSPLAKAFDYLEAQASGIDEPYLIASYSLSSSIVGATPRVEKANARLRALAHAEGPRTYWSLETNTPFYGWGLAGQVETTALVVQALARQLNDSDQEKRTLQSRGLLFLLHNQDRYGVWYSTQATINVLDAMLSLMSLKRSDKQTVGASSISVMVNGRPAGEVPLPTDTRMVAPLTVDLSSFVKNGSNQVEFRRNGGGLPVSLQVVNTYYVPWNDKAASGRIRSGDAESLKLETDFDKLESRVTGEITCHVKAERIGYRGYGMLLAEIGLPPGADVDRESLEKAKIGSNWTINQYDVLPDRVVVYLWPKAGGSEFTFKFRPRLAMIAKSASSSVYDYYNPEAKAVVAPSTFVVKQ
jgi:hypothetical protein